MLPVTHTKKSTTFQMMLYTVLTVISSFVLIATKNLGILYMIASIVLGLWFIYCSIILYVKADSILRKKFYNFFHLSNGYLALLFIVIAIDSTIS